MADELFNIEPPVIVRPFEEERPPADIPPTNVEVADEVALTNPIVSWVAEACENC